MMKITFGKVVKLLLYIILITYALLTLFPFLWGVSASFKPYREIVSGTIRLIPEEFTTDAYNKLFSSSSLFIRWIFNSFIVCFVGTGVNVILNSLAGYSLARVYFKGRDMVFYLLLATIMVPGQVLLIPNYLIVKELNMIDSFAAVIVPSAINITYIFMMRQYYINFPRDVEEAASIDGLNRLGVFFRIAIPLAKPIIATQTVFIFLGFWNEFLKYKLYLSTPAKYTLTVGIQTMMSQHGSITQWDEVMAASVISMIPILVLYIILNKFFMQGVRMDGEK